MKAEGVAQKRVLPAIEGVMQGACPERRRLATFLLGLSKLYSVGMRLRRRMYQGPWGASRRLACRVVSVGNITLGGTGKTPMTLFVAQLIHEAGYRTAVVSRGYKGSAERRGGIVSDGRRLRMGPGQAGDEPFLMARQLLPSGVPVLVGRNRVRSGNRAIEQFQSEVIVLDDGFQHLRLERDLDLVLLDAANPFGNGHLLPRGTLREPVEALARADACLLTRCPPSAAAGEAVASWQSAIAAMAQRRVRPVFPAVHRPFVAEHLPTGRRGASDALQAGIDFRTPAYAFSGIARNHDFRASLREMGFPLKGWTDFADHHAYSEEDLRSIAQRARRRGAQLLVTTEKDRVKIAPDWIRDMSLLVIGVRIDLGAYNGVFERLVCDRLGLRKKPRS